MNWLQDLLDEYPTNRSDSAIKRLARVFRNVDDGTMQAAVDAYMLDGNEFFPKVSSLVAYVREAEEQTRGPVRYNEIRRLSDDELLAIEQERGTMPADGVLGTDWMPGDKPPPVDEAKLQEIREAYARTRAAQEAMEQSKEVSHVH